MLLAFTVNSNVLMLALWHAMTCSLWHYICCADSQALDLRGNQLTGDMSTVANMPYLARVSLAGNQLTGTIPAQMASSVLQASCAAQLLSCAIALCTCTHVALHKCMWTPPTTFCVESVTAMITVPLLVAYQFAGCDMH